jgi:hypothetical protein
MAKSKPKSPTGNVTEGAKKVARGVADAAKKAVGKPRTKSAK